VVLQFNFGLGEIRKKKTNMLGRVCAKKGVSGTKIGQITSRNYIFNLLPVVIEIVKFTLKYITALT
jgi:hypothetical protein